MPIEQPRPLSGPRIQVGAASVVLPDGYAVADRSSLPPGEPTNVCIGNATVGTCAIQLTPTAAYSNRVFVPDNPGGVENPGDTCVDRYTTTLTAYREVPLGGRDAQYRRWSGTCDQAPVVVVQYTVATPGSWTLWSTSGSSAGVRQAMADISGSLVLPPRTSALPEYDHGIVRAVATRSDGSLVIQLDRTVLGMDNASRATYEYRVPPAALAPMGNATPQVGSTVVVRTDGKVVTSLTYAA